MKATHPINPCLMARRIAGNLASQSRRLLFPTLGRWISNDPVNFVDHLSRNSDVDKLAHQKASDLAKFGERYKLLNGNNCIDHAYKVFDYAEDQAEVPVKDWNNYRKAGLFLNQRTIY